MTDKEYLINLGANIAAKRKAAGFNQAQFALRCDMDRQSMSRLEKGTENIKVLTLRLLAKELGIKSKDFFDFE